jgi:filamentous hemagglutinin family protein
MNKIYRLVWNRTLQAWIPVSEISGGLARGGNKSSRSKLLVASLTLCSAVAQANPSGGVITAGSGSIDQTANTTTIHQNSQNLSLNWNSFNIGAKEIVNYIQPSASSIAVNRIIDTNATQILGQLNANGQVYLINPNGIVFGEGSQVNVGGLVASTLDINDASLNSNTKTFSGTGTGTITNKGTIVAADGGYIALLANQVSNQGIINAQLGTVALAGGSAVTLTFSDNSLVQVQVNQSTLNNLAENKQLVIANGGQVFMDAGAKASLLASVVNNTGIVEAQTVSSHNGVISLLGGMEAGSVNVAGKLDASAPTGGNGGAIETSAANVKVADGSQITTAAPSGNAGSWLIDPVDFTIAATGGNITGSALNTALTLGAVTIQTALGGTSCTGATCTAGTTGTAGDINVNDVVTWGGTFNNLLTLNAYNNININANMTATGTASLALNYGLGANASGNTSQIITAAGKSVSLPASTTNFTTTQGSDGTTKNYTVITTLGSAGSTNKTDLQGMNGDLTLNYVLGTDIDASGTSTWNTNAGFVPIGNNTNNYTGIFNGLGHTISNLSINRTSTDYIGLFGEISSSAVISNVGLVGGSIQGNNYVGGLVANNHGGTISYSYAKGNVTITGNDPKVGGLVGINSGTVRNSYIQSTGNVTGGTKVGGLVGENWGTIDLSYSLVTVNGNNRVGGLVGLNYGTIDKSYSNSIVNGQGSQNAIGGLVGLNYGGGIISNSYATGNLPFFDGNSSVGGLVGENNGSVSKSYATGSVNGSSYIGGLIGTNGGTVINSFYNSDINPTLNGIGNNSGNVVAVPDVVGTVWGMSTAALQTQANFINATGTNSDHTNNGQNAPSWDFTNIWGVNPAINQGLPYFISLPITTIYLDLIPSGSSVYGSTPTYTLYTGSGIPTAGTYVYNTSADYTLGSLVTDALSTGTITWSGSPSSASNVGTYNLTYGSGITLGNSAYTLATGNAASWSVNKANLTVTANDQTRLYGQTNPTLTETITGYVNGDNSSVVSGTARGTTSATTTTGVGTASISASTSGLTASNYDFSAGNSGILTINKAHLTVTANDQTRLYGQTNPTLTETITGYVNDEDSSVVSGTARGTTSATTTTGVGTASISASTSGLTASNYDFSAGNSGTLTINKAHLTVTANDQTRLYGQTNPTFTETITGFVNGDNSSVISGTATGSTTATSATGVGTATITASNGNLSAANYNFNNLVNGVLSINPATLTVTADNQTRLYGGVNPTFTETISGFVNGENSSLVIGTGTASSKATSTTGVGSAVITPSNKGLSAANYTFNNLVNGALTIKPVTLTVTADKQTRLFGGVNPIFTETITGFVNGDSPSVVSGTATGTSTATAATPAGTAIITASADNLTASNYNFNNLVDGELSINAIPAAVGSVSSQLVASMTTQPVVFTPPITPSTPPALKVVYSPSSDPSQGGSVTSGLNIIDGGVNTNGRSPGLYVQVLDGMIHVTNGGGAQNFSAGQFGFTPSFQQPPVILPTNPGMQFTPPPVFQPNTINKPLVDKPVNKPLVNKEVMQIGNGK